MYSNSWIRVKYPPNKIVKAKELFLSPISPTIIEWWHQVTLTPEESKMIVLSRGTLNGLKACTPIGGHWAPSSTLGESLLWKKAQKNEEKNITSETINKIIPIRNPDSTIDVCLPWKVPSRLTSRHHWNIIREIIAIPKLNKVIDLFWNQSTSPVVIPSPATDLIRGQGDMFTRWYGWYIVLEIISLRSRFFYPYFTTT